MKAWKVEVAESALSVPKQWHVRIRGGNGEIVFVSENYATRTGAKRAASRVIEAAKLGFTLKQDRKP